MQFIFIKIETQINVRAHGVEWVGSGAQLEEVLVRVLDKYYDSFLFYLAAFLLCLHRQHKLQILSIDYDCLTRLFSIQMRVWV